MKLLIILGLFGAAVAAARSKQSVKLGARATSTLNKSGRIVGGEDAGVREFPFQVSIRVKLPGQTSAHICGGTIYSERKIITAANCLVGWQASMLVVLAGVSDVRVPTADQARNVSKIEFHEAYDTVYYSNDIGIITLSEPLIFNNLVQPLRLAEPSFVPSRDAVTTGWGNMDGDGDVNFPAKLQKVTLQIIDPQTCKQDMAVIGGYVDQTMLCASASGKGVCTGDSGGPLVCKDEAGRPYLCGVVSWGVEPWLPCATPGYHDVYSNVANLRPWLESKLNP